MRYRKSLVALSGISVLNLSIALVFLPTAFAGAKLGGACTKPGSTTKVSGKTLLCEKKNKKLVWIPATNSVIKNSSSSNGSSNKVDPNKVDPNKVDPNKVDPNKSGSNKAVPMGNFLVANPVDLEHVVRLSKFRSCVGHDYSPAVLAKSSASDTSIEGKRSMKHYVIIDVPSSPSRVVKGYAPFDGTLSYSTSGYTMGIAVLITSSDGWVFEFMHVDPLVADGSKVKAGDAVVAVPANNAAAANAQKNAGGTPSGADSTNVFDIALYNPFLKPSNFETIFKHFAPNVASLWAAKGFTAESTIISKELRDASPCVTDGSWNGNFVGTAPESDYVNAIGYKP
ncbi:unannotated protein [freshwater metagenome]|uniref:Unannotated protein n=1 Tax=freshwater metagenome TaxID=449393 RepID=A0A6J6P5P4_9ZZZZ|nr:hypothetical protein [Actinomycetota bacterium]MTA36939.1 hypothetical protein [Actinomycetota bacterium]